MGLGKPRVFNKYYHHIHSGMIYVYYSIETILLALVDALRMRYKNKHTINPVGNNDISHAVSRALAVITAAATYFTVNGWHFSWASTVIAVGFIAIRFLWFDLALNAFVNFILFPRPLDYISGISSSINEQRLTYVSFWWRRLIAGSALAIVLFIQYRYL